jgi:hypothetical protein
MSRTALRAFAFDALCVLLMVVIGTRNHETDTGITGILFVAAPFWIAMSLAHLHRSCSARIAKNKTRTWCGDTPW